MSRRIIDSGRLEMKGAEVRFKQKGTLEAFDRNLAELERVFVRSTAAPNIRLFADFVFPHEVFRVWQDATLVNYKEFLEKVELAGLENFRALLRHATKASAGETFDATSRAFSEGSPPERFVNKDEHDDYDRALCRSESREAGGVPRGAAARGESTGAKGAPKARPPEPVAVKKKAEVEAAWEEMAPLLAAEEKSDTTGQNLAPIAGITFIAVGAVTAILMLRAYVYVRSLEAFADNSARFLAPIAGGGALAIAFFVIGGIYLRRGVVAAAKRKPPRGPLR